MRQIVRFTVLTAALFATVTITSAQTATGQITGTVRDSSGAVLPNAKVTVTNQGTRVTRDTVSTGSGDYTFTLLPVGTYTVSAEQKGFSKAEQSDIRLNVDQVQRVDLTLSVGATTETVTVQAPAVAVETETSSIGQVVNERQVTQLPLNGRSFLDLLFLGAGAVQTNGEQGSMRAGEGNAISINGSRPTSNNYLLDGMVNTDTALNTPAVVLSVDAIQEFKEQTTTYTAEYGFSANQINIISRGGTNQFHGALFEFDRNNFFDARSFFQASVAPLRQNQFGFVADGPVWIPKLYNGKNKTFFMANYEGQRTRGGIDQFYLVPTPAQLSGHFTSTIIDPTTGAPFLNNTVPSSRFSKLANLAVQKFFPAPNVNLSQGNYRLTTSLPNDVDQQTYRIDQNLGKFGTIFARGTKSNYSVTTQGDIAVNPALGQNFFVEDTVNWEVSHTLTIGPAMVNQFRFGYLDATANQGGYPADPADISALGLTGVFTNLSPPQRVYPSVGLSNGFSTVGGAINAYTTSDQPMWDFADSFTWVHGNHTLGIGAEYRQWKLNRDLADNFLGNFSFNGFATSPASLAKPTSDNVVADMLLGYYSTAAVFQPGGFSSGNVAGNPRTFNLKYFAPYIQDDWKVNQRLTLNLGLRWDFRTVPYETNNHMGWLDVTNPRGGLCMADKTLLNKGIDGDQSYYRYCGRTTPADPSYMPFAPRFGFAYRPFGGDKTVIRGGYGVFWDSAELRETDGSADLYPYVSRGNYIQSAGQTAPLLTTNSLFPPIVQGPAVPADNTFIAVIISESPRNPYVQQWSFSIERQLNSTTTLEVNYIGNKGTHLLERRNINQAFPPTNPANPAPLTARRPYQNFVTYINSDWSGNSSYNSGNVTLQHRSGPLGFTAVYTFAKAIDEKSAAAGIGSTGSGYQGFMDNHDARRDRGLADFDVDHRFVASFVYDLPFGRGKPFLSSTPKVVDALLGNWQLNGIVTFQRGFPYSISATDLGNVLDTNGAQRGSVIGNPYPNGFHQSIAEWFNTAAFMQPPAGVFGNTGRNILRAPGINSWNLSLFKNFPIKERVNLQLRLESFNAFNHPQWGVPNDNVSSPQFGQITSTNIPGRINQLGGKLTW
ncbi:MAG TPA: TonB-dependent receptor [Bryobacteraceae bacterium]|nr:TonB-dependent receptor [Bryobacteraceae bacterium]